MNHGRLPRRCSMMHALEDLLNHKVFEVAQRQEHLWNFLTCS